MKIDDKLVEILEKEIINAAHVIDQDIERRIKEESKREKNNIARDILNKLAENYSIAKEGVFPICQDTGIVVAFVEIGSEFNLDFDINATINEAVKRAYTNGYLRKSVVKDPLLRENTLDNTPAVIYYDITKGKKLKIDIMLKGAGSENVASLKMFNPTVTKEEIEDFIIETVKKADSNPCPPIIVGVGMGGTFEKAAVLAKKALLRKIGQRSNIEFYHNMELELLEKINNLNIGPMGYGGQLTCLDVFIETYPCHIASLPVAVNINCHVSRHRTIYYEKD